MAFEPERVVQVGELAGRCYELWIGVWEVILEVDYWCTLEVKSIKEVVDYCGK